MDIVLIYMSFVSKLAGHFGQKSGLIGHWPADIVLLLQFCNDRHILRDHVEANSRDL